MALYAVNFNVFQLWTILYLNLMYVWTLFEHSFLCKTMSFYLSAMILFFSILYINNINIFI